MLIIRNVYLSLLLFTALAGASYSQESEPPEAPKHPRQDELDEAEMRSKIALARKAEFDARFPKPSAESLATTNSVTGSLIEARMQAYKAMDQISVKIAAKVKDTKIKVKVGASIVETRIEKLYIYREDDYAKIAAYRRLIQQLRIINAEYKLCIPSPAGAPGAGLLAGLALDSLSLLKQDTTIAGAEFDIGDEEVWASLANRLAEQDIPLANPFASGFEFMDLKALAGSALMNQLNAAEEYLLQPGCSAGTNYPSKEVIDAAFKKIKADLRMVIPKPEEKPAAEAGKTEGSKKPAVQAAKADGDKKPEEQSDEEEEKPAEDEKPEPQGGIDLWEYLRVERILVAMDTEKAYWIKVKNSKSGGNVRTKASPLIDIFRGGSSVKFSGGSVAYYYIFDNSGKIVISGIESAYLPYQKSSKIAP